jgi:hypothetical protein
MRICAVSDPMERCHSWHYLVAESSCHRNSLSPRPSAIGNLTKSVEKELQTFRIAGDGFGLWQPGFLVFFPCRCSGLLSSLQAASAGRSSFFLAGHHLPVLRMVCDTCFVSVSYHISARNCQNRAHKRKFIGIWIRCDESSHQQQNERVVNRSSRNEIYDQVVGSLQSDGWDS